MLTFVLDGVHNTYNWLIKKLRSIALDFIALNDPNKKVPDSGRTRIYKKDLDPKRIDNYSDRIKREQERMKQNQSSSSKSGQGTSRSGK